MTTHNRDKIIAAAMKADPGFGSHTLGGSVVGFEAVERFYAIAFENGRQAEREDCAKICDKYTEFSGSPSNFAENCAKTIRARSTK